MERKIEAKSEPVKEFIEDHGDCVLKREPVRRVQPAGEKAISRLSLSLTLVSTCEQVK